MLYKLYIFVLKLTMVIATLDTPLEQSVRGHRLRLYSEIRSREIVKSRISPANQDGVVSIDFWFWPFEVLSLDERSRTMMTTASIKIVWEDPDLAWNESEYGAINRISLKADEIWCPEILITNSAHEDYAVVPHRNVLLDSTGLLELESPLFLKTICDLDLSNYPLDIQTCEIKFLPTFDVVKYNTTKNTFLEMMEAYSMSGEWTIEARWFIEEDDLRQNDYPRFIRFGVKLKRQRLYYMICFLAPLVITSSMTSFVFWIPPASGEKMTYLVTSFVSNALLLDSVADTIPRNFVNIPRLALFLLLSTAQCFLAMIATVIVMNRYNLELEDTTSSLGIQEQDECLRVTGAKLPEQEKTTIVKLHCHESLQPLDVSNLCQQNLEKNTISSLRSQMDFAVSTGNTSQPEDGDLKSKVLSNPPECTKRRRKCCIRASTLDKIFFVLFHVTCIPSYIILYQSLHHMVTS